MNLYRDLNNNPATLTDPLGLYDDDVHFYMTKFIGDSIGLDNCKTTCMLANGKVPAPASYAIARADAYTDYNPKTQPMPTGSGGVDRRVRFHFRTATGHSVEAGSNWYGNSNSKYPWEIAEKGVTKCDPLLTGIGLHILQDSYSHEGYSATFGHHRTFQGTPHAPDDPSRDIDKAMYMAKATYDILSDYIQKCCKKQPQRAWKAIAPNIQGMFSAGKDDQALEYVDQMVRRIARWNEFVTNRFDPKFPLWKNDFERQAAKVKPPDL